MKKKLGLVIFGPLLLSGCVEFQAPPCDVGTLKEYPSFENSRTVRLYDSQEMQIISAKRRLEKLEYATYKDSSDEKLRTCDISGRAFVEVHSKKDASYQLNLMEFMQDNSVLVSSLMINKDRLDALGVRYQVVSRDKGIFGFESFANYYSAWQNNKASESKRLLIDEQDMDKRRQTIEELVPAAILTRTFKE